MEHEKDSSQSSAEQAVQKAWGGARPGAGRPKGSTDKVTARHILETAEKIIGKPFVESLIEGYRDTILDGDRKHRVIYEKIIVDKVATTLFDVEVNEGEDALEAKRAAFAEALSKLTGINDQAK